MFRVPKRAWPSLVALGGGMLMTTVAYQTTIGLEHRRTEMAFEQLASDRVSAVQRAIDQDLRVLHGLNAYFDASSLVERHEFRTYALNVLAHHPGIHALSWVPRVQHADRGLFESNAHSNGLADFTITERDSLGDLHVATRRSEYFPVFYLEPLTQNQAALGFDLASNVARRAALESARDTGGISASSRIHLVQETEDQFGILIILPRYHHAVRLSTIDERREGLAGYLTGVLRMKDMLVKALSDVDDNSVIIAIHDLSSPKDEQLLALNHQSASALSGDTLQTSSPLSYHAEMRVGGRAWRLSAIPGPGFASASNSIGSTTIGVLGLAVSCLAAMYVALLVGREARVTQLVADRTTELSEQTSRLRQVGRDRDIAQRALHSKNTLLSAITETQSQFISNASPDSLFDGVLSIVLDLTQSEYGFIGEIMHEADGTPYLQTQAITNIAWNAETRAFYDKQAPNGLEFRNLETLFGHVITTGCPIISNAPTDDPRAGGLPPGHPSMRAFLGLPLKLGESSVGMIGIANRDAGYDEALIDYLRPLTTTCANIMGAHRTDVVRREAESTLAATNEQLEERNQEILRLVFAITHDLQTPLATLTGSVDTLRDRLGEIDHGCDRWLGRISRASERMVSMLNNLMIYAKAGSETWSDERIDVLDTLTSVVEEFRTQALKEGVDLRLEAEPCFIRGDARLLQSVCLNLIGNALKFLADTRNGVVTVKIRAEHSHVRIAIEDNGPGIPASRLEDIFEPFRRASAEISGTGLGLSIVRRYVEVLRGRVWLESDGSNGTIAFVDLPQASEMTAEPREDAA